MPSIKQYLPWWLKLWAKIVLGRIPISGSVWKKVGICEHSQSDNHEYIISTFLKAKESLAHTKGFICLELGPGDWLGSAVVAKSYGSLKTILVDVGRFARWSPAYYQKYTELLPIDTVQDVDFSDEESLLQSCQAEYLTEGIESLKQIPTSSVDLIFSSAVLEHVRRDEFDDTVKELRRILKKNGRAFHGVDLQDHLGGSLHNLRFASQFWESNLIHSSGLYTNRIRHVEMIQIFESHAFTLLNDRLEKWRHLPLATNKMHGDFRVFSEDELMIKTFEVELGFGKPVDADKS